MEKIERTILLESTHDRQIDQIERSKNDNDKGEKMMTIVKFFSERSFGRSMDSTDYDGIFSSMFIFIKR